MIIEEAPQGTREYATVTTADSADYENGVWSLHNTVHHRYAPDGLTLVDAVAAEGTLSLKIDFSGMYQPPQAGQYDKFSFAELTERAANARRLGNFRDAVNLEVERWFKLSLPLMCLVLSICSPPLGLRFARTGTFTGVLLSIVTVFVAWNTLLLMKIVGQGSIVSPLVAAWSTNVIFILFGLWMFRSQE